MVRRRKRWYWDEEKSDSRYTGNVIGRASSGWHRCLQRFARWLQEERGLAAASVTVRVASGRTFLEGQEATVRGLRRLDARDLEDFFIGYVENHRSRGHAEHAGRVAPLPAFRRRSWMALSHVADVVPSMRSLARSRVPRGRSDDEVLHALTAFVADALGKYIRSGKPETETPAVFVTTRPPLRRLSPGAITVRKASGRAGLHLRGTSFGISGEPRSEDDAAAYEGGVV